jgi:hypothetical protein
LITTVPASETLVAGLINGLPGIAVSDLGLGDTGTLTVSLTDTTGLLAASGDGTITGSGTNLLTIAGTATQVNADLATLTDLMSTVGNDSITVASTDSNGNSDSQTIAVTANALPSEITSGESLGLTTDLILSGNFLLDAGATLNLGGNILTLTGTATLNGTITGGGDIYAINADGTNPTVISTNGANEDLNAIYGTVTLEALAGASGITLGGGTGTDTLESAGSNDTLEAGTGNETLITSGTSDRLSAGTATTATLEVLSGGSGNTLYGGSGNDTLASDGSNNLLFAYSGTTTLATGGSGDALFGGTGNDTFEVLAGASGNTLYGGDGPNTYNIATGSGQNTIVNGASASAGVVNTLQFDNGVSADQVWLDQVDNSGTVSSTGNNLRLDILGTNESVTIGNWFNSSTSYAQLNEIKLTDSNVEIDSQLSNLVQAMASFETGYLASTGTAFDPTAAANANTISGNTTLLAAANNAWHT